MEEAVQHAVMSSIQELMAKEIPTNEPAPEAVAEMERQLKRTLEDLHSASSEKEEIMQRCHELDLQVRIVCLLIHTLCVHLAHAAANLNSGYSKYAKAVRVHYFCTIALRTSRAVLTRVWALRRVDLREYRVDSFLNW